METPTGFEQHAGFRFHFAIDVTALRNSVRDHVVVLRLDDTARAFIDRALATPQRFFKTRLHGLLRWVLSDFDANGLLDMYPMHLLSTKQFGVVLQLNEPVSRALDVGAGNGDVALQLRPLVSELWVTEESRAMRRRLRARGLTLASTQLTEHALRYQLVSALNVLDRTKRPRSLLQQLDGLLMPQGTLLLAVPLPLRPFYYRGASARQPLEPLPFPRVASPRWEDHLSSLLDWLTRLLPHHRLVTVSRAPYLSGGDAHSSLYVLDAAIIVLRKLRAHPQPDQSAKESPRAPPPEAKDMTNQSQRV